MSEYICPFTGDLCSRPGEVMPGGTSISREGYCGGEKPKDIICPKIYNFFKNNPMISETIIFERSSPTRVIISESESWPQVGNLLYVIENGVQRQKTKPNLPDFKPKQ